MRNAGRITEWNDDKGFGFVVPNGGGDRAFVHMSELQRGARRPVVGDLVSYQPVADARGRLQAKSVRHAGERIREPLKPSRLPRATIGIAALAAVIAGMLAGFVPLELAAVYVVASVITWAMYAMDKAAAGRGAQRVPEKTLHLLAVFGGWPGALVAQQQFRHKTIKASFQQVFWFTIVANLALVAWLASRGLFVGD